jgi:hypothetical protein
MDAPLGIGETTLETLPGTQTPPSAIYSPPAKLAYDCISVTSTPQTEIAKVRPSSALHENFNNHVTPTMFMEKLAKMMFTTKSKDRIPMIYAKKTERHVTFPDTSMSWEISAEEISRRKKEHIKLLKKRKNMWMHYKMVKLNKNHTDKLRLKRKGTLVRKKVNPGDLL